MPIVEYDHRDSLMSEIMKILPDLDYTVWTTSGVEVDLAQVNTVEQLQRLRGEHPDVYEKLCAQVIKKPVAATPQEVFEGIPKAHRHEKRRAVSRY